ncbi:MAG: Holliday junction branch migration protein RuvA [Myxococcaceae bacterium]
MIGALSGIVREKGAAEVLIDVQGVGYRVNVSTLSLTRMPDEGQSAALRIRTIVREDALDLYGFLSRPEEEMFLLLTSVSHVGPKLAMAVLSGLDVSELAAALSRGEVARLTKIHGVGRKTAERLVLELKDKMKQLSIERDGTYPSRPAKSAGPVEDVVSALVHLGYRPAQAEEAAGRVTDALGVAAPFEALLKEALKTLRAP